MISEDSIQKTLATVNYPGFSRDIVSFGLIKGIEISGDVTIKISLATSDPAVPQEIHEKTTAALEALDGIGKVNLDFDIKDSPAPAATDAADLSKNSSPGIKKIIAVGSGKGGVGKSTVAVNLAVALQKSGASVGLCDCDLYGPSVALMLGAKDKRPMANQQNEIIPIVAHGLKTVSMGFLIGDDAPVIVRGPLATKYTQQFLTQCEWGELDYLILDLPPGTGDIQLTILQTVSLDGAIIVTTPQEVALIDARKASSMFEKLNVPILGLIENMSWFECNHGERYPIFGDGGGAAEAGRLGVPLLGQIPIDMETGTRGDKGEPIATLDPEKDPISRAFQGLANEVINAVNKE